MSTNYFLAFDLGASSGRAILGKLSDGKLELLEVHRFKNQMSLIHGKYYWNIFNLFDELKTGLKKCISKYLVLTIQVRSKISLALLQSHKNMENSDI